MFIRLSGLYEKTVCEAVVEEPETISLLSLAELICRHSLEEDTRFYSRQEKGLLDGSAPIWSLPIAQGDEIVVLPVFGKEKKSCVFRQAM